MYKLCASIVIILLAVSPVFSSQYNSHEERFEAFAKSIDEAANKISWSSEYNIQDVEFVRSEFFGDERVYARAWYADYYVLIRNYRNKDWSSSRVADFWTSSEELTFLNGIKVGSPFSKVISYFGKEHVHLRAPEKYIVWHIEESDAGMGELIFSVENDRIASIAYTEYDNKTSKMSFLFNLYASFSIAEVAGENVNVREYAPAGKVRFQVSRSKGDRLLVDMRENDGWYLVAGRIVNNTLKTLPYYSISKQFVRTRRLTPSERKLFISQHIK